MGYFPYLSLSSIFALSRTSSSFQHLLLRDSNAFRYLDLSRCRGAYIPPTLTRIDSGGNSWRAERMDENLTEDEFYSGPLRGVISKLTRMKVLHTVHTLILDHLAAVTHDLISEIVTGDTYNVRLLSIRQCININQSKLQQLLIYLCRPGRPKGSPRLQGLYVFTDPGLHTDTNSTHLAMDAGVTMSQGAQLGAMPTHYSSSQFTDVDPWYAPTGRITNQGFSRRTVWEETILACRGIISFDAVLCTHMHADMAPVLHDESREFLEQHSKPGIPTLATIALGPDGCASCGRAPHGAPVWGESDLYEFPLLHPPPFSGKLIDAVRPPPKHPASSSNDKSIPNPPQRLIVSCKWCLTNRCCDSCHRWWCADCYNPKKSQKLRDLENLSINGINYVPSASELSTENGTGTDTGGNDNIKVFNGLCIENCLVTEWMAGAGGDGMWG